MTPKRTDERLFVAKPLGAAGGRHHAALERTIKALRGAGRLEEVDANLIGCARTLAEQLDVERAKPDPSLFSIARGVAELRAVDAQLRGEGAGGDDLDALVAALSAPPGDTED
jgi:hypothetical protein